MSKNRNSILDMMRFYFAIIILLYHSPQPIICFSQQLFIKGYIGVEFFFMCSGLFLIRSLKKYTEKIVTNKLYFLRIVYYKFKKIILYSILVFFFMLYFLFHYFKVEFIHCCSTIVFAFTRNVTFISYRYSWRLYYALV